ncbi:hypothetical protein JW992_08565 [candidate division KSB1 bacterium]|nr:hypothetical protein [candidate division KSB1 bacterium]
MLIITTLRTLIRIVFNTIVIILIALFLIYLAVCDRHPMASASGAQQRPRPQQPAANQAAKVPLPLPDSRQTLHLRRFHDRVFHCRIHRLQPNEDVISVCSRFGESSRFILCLSGFQNGRDVRPGDVLYFPVRGD